VKLTRREALLATASTSLAQQRRKTPQPNVIFVMADDQGYGDFSAHGHPEIRTPNLDRLRGESVRFTDFHSSPMCTPTRAQLLTGRNCLDTRAMNVSSGRTLMRTDLPTLPETFRASGYRTGLFGKWHLGDTYPYRPEDRGFDETLWYPSSHIGSVPDAWNNDYFNDIYRHNGKLEKYQGYCGDVFFREATQWIRNAGPKPFFAYIPLNVAHTPLFVPEDYRKLYSGLPENVARYSAMISQIDACMGRLDTALAGAGLRDNTILIYTSDNGCTPATKRFNAGMRGHKTELYEGGHRVPFFVRWPAGKIGGGRDVHELTQMQDVFPTMIDLCRLSAPKAKNFDGLSLAGLLQSESATLPDRTAIIQFSRMNAPRPRKDDAAVMWKRWRLIGGDELYNLDTDPGQERNVIRENEAIAARLRGHYDIWWRKVEPQLDTFLPSVVGAPQENPALLSACEWADVFLDQSSQVRRGERKNGVWHIEVARAGEYEVALRRWPKDCDAGVGEGTPPHRSEDGGYPAGVALPIRGARLRVGAQEFKTALQAANREAVFTMRLAPGRTTMQSFFLDDSGQDLLGAYYAYVTWKKN
jgi:arylsulfatase A-like enzyme